MSKTKAFADCDVDAPNLHLLMNQSSNPNVTDFFGLQKAEINQDLCSKCGICKDNCRFDAINFTDAYHIDLFACEGCALCEAICPEKAISLKSYVSGHLMLYKDSRVFSTAQLQMGSGNSGKLVSEVKKSLLNQRSNTEFSIIDGSPGIGCPVIASISGVDMVLIVSEPSVSGISDLKRIIQTSEKLQVKLAVCINKYDTNIGLTEEIETFCLNNNLHYTGRIPFDKEAVKAINEGKSIVDINCQSGEAVRIVYKKTINLLLY